MLQKIKALKLTFFMYIRSSYWVIPLTMIITSIVLAIVTSALDHWLGNSWIENSPWFLNSKTEGARAILAAIAGSMITVAGVTFSMTLVALSFTLGQLGPHLIANFMQDRANQVTLGTLVATFLYCLLILRVVSNVDNLGNDNSFVPHISILIAIVLAIVSVFCLIFFIHHIQKSINISQILSKIGNNLFVKIEEMDSAKVQKKSQSPQISKSTLKIDNIANYIFPNRNGYIININYQSLLEFALQNDCVVEIKSYPGQFVSKYHPLANVSKTLASSETQASVECFTIGSERDQEQDIFFLSDQIIEILAHALSPGINDPLTAISAVNWLQCSIEAFARIEPKHPCLYDKHGNLRVIEFPLTLTDYVNKIFDQIRAYISKDFNTSLHILNLIKQMLIHNNNNLLIKLLLNHTAYFHGAMLENINSSRDKEIISDVVTEILALKKV